MSIRTERIGEQIRGEIARLLREESSDPRIGLVTITRVKVSPDLSTALAFWSPLGVEGDRDPEQVAQGLASAQGFLRRHLARNLSLRRTPAIEFRLDSSLEKGSRTLALLSTLADEREQAADVGEEQPRQAASDATEREDQDGEKA